MIVRFQYALGATVLCIGLLLGSIGGIGSGGIIVPVLILLFHYSASYAVSLSNATIFGAALANLVVNIGRKHPMESSRTLIDWESVSLMEPLTMLGAILGTLFNRLLPSWVTVSLMVVVLVSLSAREFHRGFTLFLAEKILRDELVKAAAVAIDDSDSTFQDYFQSAESTDNDYVDSGTLESAESKGNFGDKSAAYISTAGQNSDSDGRWGKVVFKQSEERTPLNPSASAALGVISRSFRNRALKWLAALFAGVILLEVAPFVWFGSTHEISASVILAGWIICFFLLIRRDVLKLWSHRQATGYVYIRNEIEWNAKNSIIFPLVSIVAGVMAGLFGVGGGMIKGPLLLELGVHPLVAAATSSTMIFFTSATALGAFLLLGRVLYVPSLILFSLGLVVTFVGQFLGDRFVRKYNHLSVVSLSIAVVIAISAVLMGVESFRVIRYAVV